MSRVSNNYADSLFTNSSQQTQSAPDAKSWQTQAVKKEEQAGPAKQPKLSSAARKLLDRLKKSYGNMDFMVADFKNADEAQSILSRGTKEFSVLFSVDELEKMASDEKYEKEYMDKVQGAVRMSNQINQQFGFGKASEEGELTKVGISFNSDGSTSLFAELEKASSRQRERIEESRAEKRAEEKAAKKTTVHASSQRELLQKLNEVDWSKITDERKWEGDKFDFTA